VTRPHDVSVVAGGPSFGQWLDHNRLPGTVVAINDAALRLMCRVHYAVSMDRLWTENRWEALREMRLRQEHPKQFWVRTQPSRTCPRPETLTGFRCLRTITPLVPPRSFRAS